MSRFSITVGDRTFPSKKSALKFYKSIFDKYSFGQTLSDEDSESLIALGYKDFGTPEEISDFSQEVVAEFTVSNDMAGSKILGVMVDRHPEFRTTKCFYFLGLRNGEKHKYIFSYIMAINGCPTDLQSFSRACRFVVHERIRKFKIEQFKNRPVKCVLTGSLMEWEECQIDHKAPLTFSVIVKSFIVSNDIDVSKIEYIYENSKECFVDDRISEKFYNFHKNMAVLRIISTEENIKLSGSARVKPTRKDGVLKD